ncbi:RagB/SusD family nutrient uptake outer membrane protein [Chitinophaga sp. XS-30]|uniref:RagB/SusD family nutrient uptake outer membrane protein n=1 Tax=Chitinophaga sp. XS-30 TaxID=2604421 RepID=UPI0011DD32EF|nr:RagB/SusD family nutrient uptake outer membrane protein [Chitinophaga sp. XS-30]QEH41783.1 RagB/SusD family nutrient uptake outer membrane protein [Chitinophaga sp. XS-30]
MMNIKNKFMKRSFMVMIMTVVAVFFISSCKKILETIPSDFVSPEVYFTKKANFDAALNGVYKVLGTNNLYGDNYQHLVTATTDELVYATGGSIPKIPWYNATSADPQVGSVWTALYDGVDRANVVLAYIDGPSDLTDTDRKHIKGETVFLRAYLYFMLTQWYGDVPLRLTATNSPSDANMPFTPTKEVYDWVIDEMIIAEGLLSDQKATDFQYSERVTQTAVQAILARVCLYAAGEPVNDTRRYEDAAKWARLVVGSGIHKLNPDYREIFKLQTKDQYDLTYRESIWEVGFSVNSNAPEQSAPGQVRVGIPTSSDVVGRSDGRLFVYPRLFRTYESFQYTTATNAIREVSPDQRRDWCVAPFKYSGGGITAPPAMAAVAYNLYYTRYPGKWRRTEENEPRLPTQSPTNYSIIRYADVLLMLAEAETALNSGQPTSEAIELVNQVRRRAYGEFNGKIITGINVVNGGTTDYSQVPTVTISGAGGTGATAVAVLTAGKVSSIQVTDPGENYPDNTTVTISPAPGDNGAGAAATAVLNGNGELSPDQTIDQGAFLKAIQDERLMELNGEFLRKQDLKRWGILVSTVKQMRTDITSGSSDIKPSDGLQLVPPAVVPYAPSNVTKTHYTRSADNIEDKNIFLPIPIAELLYNNQAKQNPGY